MIQAIFAPDIMVKYLLKGKWRPTTPLYSKASP
jgi:hypothetical protein